MKMSPFSAPFFWGTQKREAAAPKPSDCISGGAQANLQWGFRRFLGRRRKSRRLEGAGRRNLARSMPRKMSGRKRVACRTQKDPGGTVPDGRKSDGRFEDTCFFKSLVPVASK